MRELCEAVGWVTLAVLVVMGAFQMMAVLVAGIHALRGG